MLLEDKNAVIYRDGGKVAGASPGSSSSVELWRVSRRSRRLRQAKMEGTRRGEPMNSKLVFSALCTEDILIANEPCGGALSLEVEFYV